MPCPQRQMLISGRSQALGGRSTGAGENAGHQTLPSESAAASALQTHRFIHLSVRFLPHHPEGPLPYLSLDSISGFQRPPPVGGDWEAPRAEAGDHCKLKWLFSSCVYVESNRAWTRLGVCSLRSCRNLDIDSETWWKPWEKRLWVSTMKLKSDVSCVNDYE